MLKVENILIFMVGLTDCMTYDVLICNLFTCVVKNSLKNCLKMALIRVQLSESWSTFSSKSFGESKKCLHNVN